MNSEKPKNTFRDEIVSEQDMMDRDAMVGYLYIKNQVQMREADFLHLQGQVARLKAFGNQVFRLPDSEQRKPILDENQKNIEQIEKQLEAYRPSRAQQVLLSVLEEKFGEDKVVASATIVKVGDEAPISDEPKELKDE